MIHSNELIYLCLSIVFAPSFIKMKNTVSIYHICFNTIQTVHIKQKRITNKQKKGPKNENNCKEQIKTNEHKSI